MRFCLQNFNYSIIITSTFNKSIYSSSSTTIISRLHSSQNLIAVINIQFFNLLNLISLSQSYIYNKGFVQSGKTKRDRISKDEAGHGWLPEFDPILQSLPSSHQQQKFHRSRFIGAVSGQSSPFLPQFDEPLFESFLRSLPLGGGRSCHSPIGDRLLDLLVPSLLQIPGVWASSDCSWFHCWPHPRWAPALYHRLRSRGDWSDSRHGYRYQA